MWKPKSSPRQIGNYAKKPSQGRIHTKIRQLLQHALHQRSATDSHELDLVEPPVSDQLQKCKPNHTNITKKIPWRWITDAIRVTHNRRQERANNTEWTHTRVATSRQMDRAISDQTYTEAGMHLIQIMTFHQLLTITFPSLMLAG